LKVTKYFDGFSLRHIYLKVIFYLNNKSPHAISIQSFFMLYFFGIHNIPIFCYFHFVHFLYFLISQFITNLDLFDCGFLLRNRTTKNCFLIEGLKCLNLIIIVFFVKFLLRWCSGNSYRNGRTKRTFHLICLRL
jgi:hypothetical protein